MVVSKERFEELMRDGELLVEELEVPGEIVGITQDDNRVRIFFIMENED